ncbi:MAG: 4Fe-4S binding protein [Bacteroidales bacterium]|nr:4Fe-4S binding protein [Bacteroidales bacterium]MCF8405264.1 4Fe-4S binding protein [Bacteroidales bacterium]
MNKGFVFDQNKCVGCHACVVACQIENGGDQHIPWREISTFNSYHHPKLPSFHYSLACNHCEHASCMESCPALAYTIDDDLNTIIHHPDRCIGCKYCTWACPYDAPKYVESNGIVEKCTACLHRLEKNLKPACAHLCPTGALDFKDIEIKNHKRLSGYTEANLGARIDIIRLRKQRAPISALQLDKSEEVQFIQLEKNKPGDKINIKKEWVLVFFTLIIPFLTALATGGALGFFQVDPYVFLSVGVLGSLLSIFHLGKKARVWRAVLNVRSSWLSREVLSYGLFLGLSAIFLFFPEYSIIGFTAAFFGFICSYFADKVYQVVEKTTVLNIHSSSVFLTAILFTTLLTNNYYFALFIMGFKALLYLYRKIYFVIHNRKLRPGFIFFRISLGLVLPLIFWDHSKIGVHSLIFCLIVAGEVIDRIEFYMECSVITPKGQLLKDMLKGLPYLPK